MCVVFYPPPPPTVCRQRPFARRSAWWQPAGDHGATAVASLERDLAAVSIEDLAAERQAEAAAPRLRGVEGQQRLSHGLVVHAVAAVGDLDPGAAAGRRLDSQADLRLVVARLDGILEQVDQHLAELGRVEPSMGAGQRALQLHLREVLEGVEEAPPLDLLGPRPRQSREARIAVEEALQVVEPLAHAV